MPNSNPACGAPAGPLSCCNREVLLQLTASLTNVSDCGALSGVSLTLNLDNVIGEKANWNGSTDVCVCGSEFHLRFTCSGTNPNNFSITSYGWGVGIDGPPPIDVCLHPFTGELQSGATCNPINAEFDMGSYTIEDKCACCTKNKNIAFDIVITE